LLGQYEESDLHPASSSSFAGFDWLTVWIQRHTVAVVRRCNSRTPAPIKGYLTKRKLKPLASRKDFGIIKSAENQDVYAISGSLVLSDYAKTRDGFPSIFATNAVYGSNSVSPV